MRCDSVHEVQISGSTERLTCVYKQGHQGDHQCADISWRREVPAAFALSQFQQQVVRDVLLAHRMNNDSFCSGYEKAGCKYRIPFGSTPHMREAHAQHQVDEIIKALS